ncbi:RNA polymerase I-specific transcription initiation factor RRN6-like protein [Clohesyomyces aquaticus]|uniref:RNA polymerase I-specific transcription initiation factor RRN6-like protein n=1 Tax=Clohesyomyces aquaticus TaxID=1231657 RepID=A0A1Y1ZH71_9PLEO|nr:RNA polymerase I-specific transcription initiation factor RRN6-like protein [Clohesyomyces aquaticus]
MADLRPHGLNFGHLGHATYNIEDGAWDFSRHPGARRVLRQLGEWKRVISLSVRFDETSTREHGKSFRAVQQEAKALVRNNPELHTSVELLPELALASSAVTFVTSTYDATVGDLVAFGSFTLEGHWKSPRRIGAIATGEVGNILRLVVLAKERHGWEQDKSIWVEGPAVVDEECGYWIGDAVPIQQLCFAQSEDRSSFLAARFPTRTVLFRPIQRDSPIRPPRSPFYELPASCIDANPIVNIGLEKTGGVPHADVTFNPDYQRQVGFVDQDGNWSIWDIESGHRGRSQYTVSCANRGSVVLDEEEEEDVLGAKDSSPREDGWARILWIGDVNTIVVCNRRRLRIYDFKGEVGRSTMLRCDEVILPSSADWILDVRRSLSNKHHFFVLTSSRLYLMQVTCLNDARGGGRIAGATVLISWTHFRGLDDITLQLCLAPAFDEGSVVILYSHLNTMFTVFRFQDHDRDASVAYSNSDPTQLKLDESMFDSEGTPRHIIQLNASLLRFGGDDNLLPTGPGHDYMSSDVQFYRLSVTLSDLSLHETLLYALAPPQEDRSKISTVVERPEWSLIVHSRAGQRSRELVDNIEDFVVPDGIGQDSAPRFRRPFQSPRLVRGRGSRASGSAQARSGNVLANCGSLYEALVAGAQSNDRETVDITTLMEGVKRMLGEDSQPEEITRDTILTQAESEIAVAGVDEASRDLEALFTPTEEPSQLQLTRIASDQVLRLSGSDGHEATISSLYDTMLQNWIAPLPNRIPVRIRKGKELLARRIAAEIMLASSRIRHIDSTSPTDGLSSSQAYPSQDIAVALPILPSRKGKEKALDPSSSQPFPSSQFSLPSSQNALPTPKQTPSSASNSPSGPPFTSTPAFSPTENPLTRLSQHLQITKPPLETMPAGVNNLLMHWPLGTDPNTYDWAATSRAIQESLELEREGEDSDGVAAAKRAKAKRKEERRVKRQRREAETFSRSQSVFSQPTLLAERVEGRGTGVRSSPVPGVGFGGGGMAGSSSQVVSQSHSQGVGMGGFVVQSQVEMGGFGGRPPTAKKRKKGKSRVRGF